MSERDSTKTKRVIIGIQARLGSRRFPEKILSLLGDKTVLDHVIYACRGTQLHLNANVASYRCFIEPILLIPEGDQLKELYAGSLRVFEGPEDDVLTRYYLMAAEEQPDYIVRITADCPLIQSFLITRHIIEAVKHGHDYLSDVDEECRTSFDGNDCEIFSFRLLEHAYKSAKEPYDREHVTPFMRRDPPNWAQIGVILHAIDVSDWKLSLDTPEDLERIKRVYERRENKKALAFDKFGRKNVHFF